MSVTGCKMARHPRQIRCTVMYCVMRFQSTAAAWQQPSHAMITEPKNSSHLVMSVLVVVMLCSHVCGDAGIEKPITLLSVRV